MSQDPRSPQGALFAVYGPVPTGLVAVPGGSIQCSPLVPGARVLSGLAHSSLAGLVLHAPASTIERRHVMALALQRLKPGGALTVLAANDKGGTRLAQELASFGCAVSADHKRHHRIVSTQRPDTLTGLEAALGGGCPQLLPELGLWSQPGLFNWDRIDPGSQLLIDHLPLFWGRGADLGCGIGVLARSVMLKAPSLSMTLIDLDQRALEMARRNVPGSHVTTLWADVRTASTLPTGLDFVVMNPPFHDGGEEDRALGHAFIEKAALMLRPGGVLWLTANRHLPYEATLTPLFETVNQVAQAKGFKIYSAQKAPMSSRTTGSKARL